MPSSADFQIIYNMLLWVERYLFEIADIDPRPFPALSEQPYQTAVAIAPNFFKMIRALLYDAAVLGTAMLWDLPTQSGHKNLSLETVIQGADWLNPEQKENALEELKIIRRQFPQIKFSRNKVLAHADYDVVTGLKDPATHSNHVNLEQLTQAVRKTRCLVARIRPQDVPAVPEPLSQVKWLGVAVVLDRLSRS